MTIGLALLIITVLILIERHNLWKWIAVRLSIGVGVCILAYGSWWGWTMYKEHREAKAAATKAIAACLTRNTVFNGIDLTAGFSQNYVNALEAACKMEQPGETFTMPDPYAEFGGKMDSQEDLAREYAQQQRAKKPDGTIDYDELACEAGAIDNDCVNGHHIQWDATPDLSSLRPKIKPPAFPAVSPQQMEWCGNHYKADSYCNRTKS